MSPDYFVTDVPDRSTWLPVDPTFGQIGVDATHIQLLEGEGSAELMPLVEVVGKIKARVLSLEE